METSSSVYTVTNAGATVAIDEQDITEIIYLAMDSGAVTLAANYSITYTALPASGSKWSVIVGTTLALNGNTCTIFGVSYTSFMQGTGVKWIYEFEVVELASPTLICSIRPIDLTATAVLSGAVIKDATLDLTAVKKASAGKIVMFGASTDATATTVTGDVTITSAGVTAIGAGVIVNADVNASAAIAVTKLAPLTASKLVASDASGFLTSTTTGLLVNADVNASAAIALSKLAALTASKVAVTDGSGVITTANQLSATLGGTALDTSASTGVPKVVAGTWSVGARTEMMTLMVSFEAAAGVVPSVGDFKLYMPFAGTVTGIYAYATKAIAGTDAGTIIAKNNAGTTMTNGTITFAASDTRGTAYTVSPSANNTFIATDVLTFTTAKVTAGGYAQLSITFTRTT